MEDNFKGPNPFAFADLLVFGSYNGLLFIK